MLLFQSRQTYAILPFARLLLVALLACCQSTFGSSAGSADLETARAISKILASRYDRFDDRKIVEKTKKGKIYFFRPSVNGKSTFNFYEITTDEDISLIKAIAESALKEVNGANSIILNFYESQNWHRAAGGGSVRHTERLIKSITIKRLAKEVS